MIHSAALWEMSGAYWPVPFRPYVSEASSMESTFSPGKLLTMDIPFTDVNQGWFVTDAKVYNDKCYVVLIGPVIESTCGSGFKIIYTEDFETWQENPNGVLTDMGISYWFTKVGSNYYVFTCCFGTDCNGGTNHGDIYVYPAITDDPEDWDAGDFGSPTRIADVSADRAGGTYTEDGSVAFDGNHTWYLFMTVLDDSPAYYGIDYWTLDTDSETFPAGDWVYQGAVSYEKPPFVGISGSPKLINDGTYWWLTYNASSSTPPEPATFAARWRPNWIVSARSETLDGTFEVQNEDIKYYQATYSSGKYKSYLTTPTFTDFEIIAEVQTGLSGEGAVGVIFSYDSATDSGYYADLIWDSGSPKCRLYKFVSTTYTALATAVSIANFPTPSFKQGYPTRIKVQKYGNAIDVYYSLWGNEWVHAFDLTDNTYWGTKVGVESVTTNAYWDDFRVREIVFNEPIMGEAGEEEDLVIVTLAATSVKPTSAILWGNSTGVVPTSWVAFWWGDDCATLPTSMAVGDWDNYYPEVGVYEQGEAFSHAVSGLPPDTMIFVVAGGNSTSGAFDAGVCGNFTTLAITSKGGAGIGPSSFIY